MAKVDEVGKLSEQDQLVKRLQLSAINPNDGKYSKESKKLANHLSAKAEWFACAYVQRTLLETRVEFGKAEPRHLKELDDALPKIDPLNIALIEDNVTRHDQLAVLEELGNHISEETKSLLHPGTTSYDILDTTRSMLLKSSWHDIVKPKICEVIKKLCVLADDYKDVIQAGRTHLQRTSPVLFGQVLAGYAKRLADRLPKSDDDFNDLRGKVSGIVGTGGSIDAVIGEGSSLRFEEAVLKKLYLKPDLTATQIVQKERLSDIAHNIVALMSILGDFANNMRILYSSDIGEVTSGDGKERLGGSSADPSKNNPINWENIAGKVIVVQSAMPIVYAQIQTDLQRDLRGSVQARYEPANMIAETYESFARASSAIDKLLVLDERMKENLVSIRKFPSEAITAIARGRGWIHSKHGVSHNAIKELSKGAKKSNLHFMEYAMQDPEFKAFYDQSSDQHKAIMNGELELYLGSARERTLINSVNSEFVDLKEKTAAQSHLPWAEVMKTYNWK